MRIEESPVLFLTPIVAAVAPVLNTVRLSPGLVAPIPTLPPERIRMRSVAVVLKIRGSAF
jgi:hypothetical protein